MPEPDNAVDRHAIAIHMRWITKAKVPREVWDHIGYVPGEMAEIVNALIGSGEWAIENAYVRSIEDGPDVDAPRVIVRLEGKDLRE